MLLDLSHLGQTQHSAYTQRIHGVFRRQHDTDEKHDGDAGGDEGSARQLAAAGEVTFEGLAVVHDGRDLSRIQEMA
ncbi:MAG: hypothetical protein DI592_09225 [Stenotrophomonas maltophilia]|nr:MAG: hypothetical protein DI592_09225 [Stenotrophomonas maltophilia]